MTSYLLDTSAMLWALTEPARLSRAARRVIESRSSRLVVSAVSAWELSTKHRLGKLPQADVLLGAYTQHLDRLGVLRLPVARTTRCWPAGWSGSIAIRSTGCWPPRR